MALAQTQLPKMFPMMMTAAGTIKPAKVFIIGAGVAGLQCIASAKRAGAVVYAFDVRPEVKEQIESLGGKFLEIEVADARGEGGYARELTDEEKKKQQEMMAEKIAESDLVITTAGGSRQEGPRPHHRRRGASDAHGQHDHRHGGRARRQLRADEGGRDDRR